MVELMVTLSILSLLTVSVATIGLGNSQKVRQDAFNAECETILYTLLQYKDEAIMDGYQRKVRFFKKSILINWTKDRVNHQISIPLQTCSFVSTYEDNPLQFTSDGTVSKGGTVTLTSYTGAIRKITIQVASGRIYLDEP